MFESVSQKLQQSSHDSIGPLDREVVSGPINDAAGHVLYLFGVGHGGAAVFVDYERHDYS